tara:strand:- start:996 stop:1565 length:570 start_codon:yes stop_codon:yes gene_type:complete
MMTWKNMTDIKAPLRFFLSQKKLSQYELHEQGAIKVTNQDESDDCEIGYPEDWLEDNHVWIDAAKELERLGWRFGDVCSACGYEEAQAYLGDIDYIIKSVSKFMEEQKEKSIMFRIWFNDGSSVKETAGGYNLFDKDQLPNLADQFDFDADELLHCGETKMLDEQGEVIGGVNTVLEGEVMSMDGEVEA